MASSGFEESMNEIVEWIQYAARFPLITIFGTEVTPGRIALALFVVVAFYSVSWSLKRLIRGRLAGRLRVDQRVLYASLQILHWLLLFVGVFLALQVLGFNLTSLAVAAGFLGVGIGLGLQNVVANFVAGILLLFEQSLAVGDRVEVGGHYGDVQKITMRATEIRTRDNIAIIVPNSRFIDSEVINWSHGDRRVREHVRVGVAHGSDVEVVRDTLLRAAAEHPRVLKDPPPRVWFLDFGESSLIFELLVWISEPLGRQQIRSDIHFSINRIFREAGIRLPFPQMDLHVRDWNPLSPAGGPLPAARDADKS
jgi:small-conductance mechanosensitive channel